jgi:outer membrane lipoprotein LolB
VTLTDAQGREHRAADAEALTEQTLGFRLPLAGLADWVRARPGPGPSQVRKDDGGRITELEQSGWKIEYLEWGEDGRLPARMKLSYPGLELRLAIAQWK